ncbi:MAG: ChaN family lipoprotein [Verrucomicrobiota bacterium]
MKAWWLWCFFPFFAKGQERPALWVDLVSGEPVRFAEMVDDLASARVVYAGETHRIARHHALQLQLLEALAERGKRVVLGLEQIEVSDQEAVSRFNAGQLDFEGLAEAISWKNRWSNYLDYRAMVEKAQTLGLPVLALNAQAEMVRKIGRGGLGALSEEERAALPELDLSHGAYRELLDQLLLTHAEFTPEMLGQVYAAQVTRDERMAETLAEFLRRPGEEETMALVVVGSGHVRFGLGLPERMARRWPGLRDRIVLFSDSGDLELTEAEQAQARPVGITHQDLRDLGAPPGDYLHVTIPRPSEPAAE